jgi:Spore coat protein Z
MQHRHPGRKGLGCFLKIVKNQQDQLKGMKTDICSSLLAKLFDGDTIPIMLTINNEYFQAAGSNDHGSFCTKYFRIESMDEETNSVTLSLLKPFDICNDFTPRFNELYRLVKTDTCITLCIDTISAIQCLDIDLMTKKVTIEPKW